MLSFASDYMKGAHPAIITRLVQTNLDASAGYGTDSVSALAREKIRKACACKDARVEFLVGGTQTNALVIDAFLNPVQGVIAAETGHISTHESGAVEATGHKVLTLPQTDGKLNAGDVRHYLQDFYQDGNHEHMVLPGMVYISHPTEYGTLYTKAELQALHEVCAAFDIPLYMDGARLAYALASSENDLALPDIARLCDAFYIGGTKCGALFGEALVIPDPHRIPYLFTLIKQHGALLAKGRLLGLQFDEFFTDGLYYGIGESAVRCADRIREALLRKGYSLHLQSPTNQIFVIMENSRLEKLAQEAAYTFWEKTDETHSVIRLVTDWATTEEEVTELLKLF